MLSASIGIFIKTSGANNRSCRDWLHRMKRRLREKPRNLTKKPRQVFSHRISMWQENYLTFPPCHRGIWSGQSILVGDHVSAYPVSLRIEPACRKRQVRGAGFSPEAARLEDASADRAAAGPNCDIIRCS